MLELLSKLINMMNSDQFDQVVSSNFQNLGVYFYSKDKNGKYLSCNDEMACLAGLNKSIDMLGKTDFDFVWSEEAPLFKENDQRIISKGESVLFLEHSAIFNGSNYTKAHLLSYKKPLHNRSRKIIGIKGLSFILNGYELPFDIMRKHQLPKNLDSYENITFYSNLEKYDLSKRQKECLYYLTKGMSLKQIARILNISPRTVEHHIESIKIKFGCFSRTHLIEKMLIESSGTSFR